MAVVVYHHHHVNVDITLHTFHYENSEVRLLHILNMFQNSF